MVSLSPAATEMVYLVGAGADLVGRTAGCDFPEEAGRVPVVAVGEGSGRGGAPGGWAEEDAARVAALRPGVVLAPAPAGSPVAGADVGPLAAVAGAEVVWLGASTVEGVLDDIGRVGAALGRDGESLAAVVGLRERMFAASEFVNPFDEGPGVLFLEPADPLRVGGGWVPQLIERAGGRPLLNATSPREGSGAAIGPQMAERVAGPAVAVTEEAAAQAVPDWVVVAGEDLPGARRRAAGLRSRAWFRATPAARRGRVLAVDGRVFLRPGPRIVGAFELLVAVLNDRPAVAPAGVGWELV